MMITKFKIFENFNINEPEIGDYVICFEYTDDIELLDFISKNIGKYVGKYFDPDIDDGCTYDIKYLNTPKNLINYFNYQGKSAKRLYNKNEILYWSKYKKDLEKFLPLDIATLLNANKFNL